MVGLLGFRIPGISDMIDKIVEVVTAVVNLPNILITAFQYFVSLVLYGVQVGFFYIINCIQDLFRAFAGLSGYYFNGQARSGDIVFSLLQSDTIMSVFWSVLIASVFLLFVTTTIAILKTEVDLSKSNAKGPIWGRAFKSIFYFALVPVCCIMGIYISNVFLQTFDSATSKGADSMAAQIFNAAAYDANRARNDSGWATYLKDNGYVPGGASASADQATIANAIDDAFRSCMPATDSSGGSGVANTNFAMEYDADTDSYTMIVYVDNQVNNATIQLDKTRSDHMQGYAYIWSEHLTFSEYSITYITLVYYYYNLLDYNYLIGLLTSFMVSMLLLTLIIGVIQRIFELSILFVVSPAFVATMPLDEGARYNKWRDAFVKRVFSAYGPVIGINLLFMILTFVQQIDIFQPGGINNLFNAIVQVLFIVVGLISVKDFSALISDLIGSNDALKDGESKKDATKELGGRIGTVAATGVRMGAKTAAWGGRRASTWGKNRRNINGLANELGRDGDTRADRKANKRLAKDLLKKGEATVNINGKDTKVSADRYLSEKQKEKYSYDKSKPKLRSALSKEIHKMDNTITGGMRKRWKDADDKNANPFAALIGDTFDKRGPIRFHKDDEREGKERGRKKELEADEVARELIAQKAFGDFVQKNDVDAAVQMTINNYNNQIQGLKQQKIDSIGNKSMTAVQATAFFQPKIDAIQKDLAQLTNTYNNLKVQRANAVDSTDFNRALETAKAIMNNLKSMK